MLIRDGILNGDIALGSGGLFTVYRCLCSDFGNAVVYNRNADGLPVLADADGIDFLIGEVSVRRLQLLNEPIAVRNIFKGEDTVLAGFCNEECVLGSKLNFVTAEESELCADDGLFGFTVNFQSLDRAVEDIVLNGFAAVCLDLHKGGILSGVFKGHGVFFIRKDIMVVGHNFLYIQLRAYGDVCLEDDIAVFIAVGDFKQSVLRDE